MVHSIPSCLGIFIGLALQYLLCEFFRNVAVEGLRHYGELAQLGERLDGRNDRDGYAHLPSLLHESIELLVVVEELGNGIAAPNCCFSRRCCMSISRLGASSCFSG